MPNIHQSLVHVPGAAEQAAAAAAKHRPKKASWIANAVANRTSEPGKRAARFGSKIGTGGKFGQLSEDQRFDRSMRRLDIAQGATTGAPIGLGAGLIAGGDMDSRSRKIASNQRKIKRNKQKLSKAATHLITDLGTPAEKTYKYGTKVLYGAGAASAAGGAALTAPLAIKHAKKQKATLKRQEATLKRQQLSKSAFGVEHTEFTKRAPVQRIGRGVYIYAPRLRDKLKSPTWMANAVVNNPGNAMAAGGVGGGSLLLADRKKDKVRKADDRDRKVAGGALVGAGGAQLARVGTSYGTKEVAERQLAPHNAKGKGWNYGPYKDESPHKKVLNSYKRTVKGDVRTKAKMFDANFPKGVPSYHARKLGVLLDNPKTAAATVVGGAAAGALYGERKSKLHKSMTSAFGVDHG